MVQEIIPANSHTMTIIVEVKCNIQQTEQFEYCMMLLMSSLRSLELELPRNLNNSTTVVLLKPILKRFTRGFFF